MYKTNIERAEDKRRSRVEKVATWFVRWSQVLFWVGLIGIIGEMLYLYATKDVAMVYSWWQQALLYCIGIISVLFFVIGLVVFNMLCSLDERSARRERR